MAITLRTERAKVVVADIGTITITTSSAQVTIRVTKDGEVVTKVTEPP